MGGGGSIERIEWGARQTVASAVVWVGGRGRGKTGGLRLYRLWLISGSCRAGRRDSPFKTRGPCLVYKLLRNAESHTFQMIQHRDIHIFLRLQKKNELRNFFVFNFRFFFGTFN